MRRGLHARGARFLGRSPQAARRALQPLGFALCVRPRLEMHLIIGRGGSEWRPSRVPAHCGKCDDEPMDAEPKQRDGRTVRAERTREALVGALLALLNEGHVRPTASEIAERADVGALGLSALSRPGGVIRGGGARAVRARGPDDPPRGCIALPGRTRGRARDSALLDVREGGRRASRGAADGARV